MITVLIRTHPGREVLLERAIASVPKDCDIKIHFGEKVSDFSYNLYCNKLKNQVKEGYFFFLDSDDVIIPDAIDKIRPYLNEDTPMICQMLRNGKPKPVDEIKKGHIGLPCLILHSKHKNIADLTNSQFGDWDWIYQVITKLGANFIQVPLVNAGKRNFGK